MREVERINFNQYLEGFEKSNINKIKKCKDAELFDVEEAKKFGCNELFDTNQNSAEIIEQFNDGTKAQKSYSLSSKDESGTFKYNVTERHTDAYGNEQVFNGVEYFNEDGRSYFFELSTENEDGLETNISKLNGERKIEIKKDNNFCFENFNSDGELIEYSNDYMHVNFNDENPDEIDTYVVIDSDRTVKERYIYDPNYCGKEITFNDKTGNSIKYRINNEDKSSDESKGKENREVLNGSIIENNVDGPKKETYFFSNKTENTNKVKINEFDENYNIISSEIKVDKDQDGTVDETIKTTFDSNGNIISRSKKLDTNKDGIIDYTSETTYDENKNKLSETKFIDYDKDGNGDDFTKLEFDTSGNIINEEYKYYVSEKISENTKQGKIGDCAIFSGLNGFSYSEKGQELLKKSLTQNEDGSFNVYFAGLEKSFTVTQKDIHTAKKEEVEGSPEDNTQLVYLLAIKKAFTDIRNNKLDYSIHENFLVNWDKKEDPREGGYLGQSAYLLTGQEAITCHSKISQKKILEKFQNNPDEIVANANFTNFPNTDEFKYLTDINGKEYAVASEGHACSIKAVTDDTVTIVNPWNGKEEIVVDKEEFLNNVEGIEYVDLNDERSNSASEKFKKGYHKFKHDTANIICLPIDTLSRIFSKKDK